MTTPPIFDCQAAIFWRVPRSRRTSYSISTPTVASSESSCLTRERRYRPSFCRTPPKYRLAKRCAHCGVTTKCSAAAESANFWEKKEVERDAPLRLQEGFVAALKAFSRRALNRFPLGARIFQPAGNIETPSLKRYVARYGNYSEEKGAVSHSGSAHRPATRAFAAGTSPAA